MELLSSKNSSRIKLLKSLFSQKKAREEANLFSLEGARLIEDALESSVEVEFGFATKQAMDSYPDQTRALQNNTKGMYEISESLAHWVADTKNPQGLFAICKKKKIDDNLEISPKGRYLILHQVENPGNMGTLLRTALSFNIDGCFISSDSVEIYSPKVVRSSMGAVLKLPLQRVSNIQETIKKLQSKGITVYAAAIEEKSKKLSRELFNVPSGVIIGNEARGISPEILQAVDATVMIPMAKGVESLNASIAGGIFLWEMNQGRMLEKE